MSWRASELPDVRLPSLELAGHRAESDYVSTQ